MELLENDLDFHQVKIAKLEQDLNMVTEQLSLVMDQINRQTESIKETQRYLIKLARNQQDLTKRITSWPYIVVSNKDEEM